MSIYIAHRRRKTSNVLDTQVLSEQKQKCFEWTSERLVTTRRITEVSRQRIPSRWSSDSEGPTTKWAELVTRHKKLVTRYVEVCDCPHDNLTTIAHICFPLGSLEKIKITGRGQGHFSDGSRSLSKVMSCCITGCEISSLTTSSCCCCCSRKRRHVKPGGHCTVLPRTRRLWQRRYTRHDAALSLQQRCQQVTRSSVLLLNIYIRTILCQKDCFIYIIIFSLYGLLCWVEWYTVCSKKYHLVFFFHSL